MAAAMGGAGWPLAASAEPGTSTEAGTGRTSGAIGMATAQVLRGVSISNGAASLSVDLNHRFDSGWALGASLATLGRDARGGRWLLGVSASRSWQFDADWAAQAGLAHYAYPGGGGRHRFDYEELSASIGWLGRWSATLAVLPNTSRRDQTGQPRRGRAAAVELALHQPLGGGLAFDAGLGWMDLRRIRGAGYGYGSLGLGWSRGPLQVHAMRVFSQAAARGLATPEAGVDRWVASVGWNF